MLSVTSTAQDIPPSVLMTFLLSVYPNPAGGVVRIEGVVADEVQVYNALGQMVKTVRGTNEIDVADLVEGVYLVRIADAEGKVYTNKITVQ